MPQANLETLVCACGSCGTKVVVCETLATKEGDSDDRLRTADELLQEETPPDFPPESFLLSKDAELEWFDNNAFLERKDSQRRSSFSSSTNPNLNSVPSSQRFPLRKSKTSILGLPKPHNSCFVESKNRKNTGINTRLFPKRSGSVKSDPPVNEPSSPKVSCMGRVRSKRDRHRRLIKNRQNSAGAEAVKKKMTRKGSGFFSSFRAIFRCNGKAREKHALQSTLSSSSRESDFGSRLPADDGDAADTLNIETKREPVSLGGMKRFASGRRSDPLI